MENQIYKCAVIGLGRIGAGFDDNHCNAYKKCERTKLVAVADSNFDKAFKVADQYECNPYADYMAMVNKDRPDIVSVCVPEQYHAGIVRKLAGNVKAIYCEKPISTNLKDAEDMIKACHAGKTLLQINHQRRFLIPTFYYSRGILNTGTHMMDLLRELFGEIEVISAEHTDKREDPNPLVYVRTARGLVIKLSPHPTNEPVFHFMPSEVHDFPILEGVKEIVSCLDEGRESISSGEDGLEALRLVLKVKEVADERR